jgi:hypothetical protein
MVELPPYPSPEADPPDAPSPVPVGLAAGLLVVFAVLGLTSVMELYRPAGASTSNATAMALPFVVAVLHIVYAIAAGTGRRVGRIVVSVTGPLLVVWVTPGIWLGFVDRGVAGGPVLAVLDLVGVVAAVAGLVLLWLPASGAYLRWKAESLGLARRRY